jgi:hypothetical protein
MIDLGLMDHHRDDEFGESGSGVHRPSRWLVLFLLVACCATALNAAGPPPAQARLEFAAADVLDTPRLTATALLANVDGPEGPIVTAYALGTGRVRWRYRPPRRVAIVPAGPVVLLVPTACQSVDGFVTTALDATTGETRWTRRGVPVWTVPGAFAAVFKQPVSGCTEATIGFDPSPAAPFVWAGIELETGATRWSVPVPPAASLSAGTDGDGHARWLAVGVHGVITAYDLRGGEVVGVMPAPPEPMLPTIVRLIGAGEHLLVIERGRRALTVSAFAAPDLVQRWRAVIPAERGVTRLELDSFAARSCGPVVCLGSATQTVGIDPATGVERWRVQGRPIRIGPPYALFVRAPELPGRPMFTVYDLRTGTAPAQLPGGELIGRLAGAALLTTPDATGGRLWRVELTSGVVSAVTTLPRQYLDCDAAGRYLACRTGAGALDVWLLPVRCGAECGSDSVVGEGSWTWPRF